MNRRHFLMSAAAAAPAMKASALASANDRVRVACVGVRGQGNSHIRAFSRLPNVEVAALCDVDESVLALRVKDIESKGGKRPATFSDFRKLLEDTSIDAVGIATPNHWHTLQTIWACQAGKDVYVEKPCSHNMFEARQIVAAAQKYERIVQHGTNLRSDKAVREAVRQLREGLIGDVYMARGVCFKWRDTIARTPDEAAPAGVDYNLWLGPAPVRPFSRNRFHYNWHWNWEYGNGEIGNQGIHHLDVTRWGLGVTYPSKITAIGGHFMFDDDQQTPNTITALFEFDGAGKRKTLVFDVRHWITNKEAGIGGPNPGGNATGHLFYGSKGYMVVEDGRFETFLGKEQAPGPSMKAGGNNWANFIDVVRSRRPEDRNAPIEEGAISTTLFHLANISYRLGRTLHFDAAAYRCTGDDEANAMFTRDYRRPFVVPETV